MTGKSDHSETTIMWGSLSEVSKDALWRENHGQPVQGSLAIPIQAPDMDVKKPSFFFYFFLLVGG